MLFAATVMAACTKGFEEMNRNPNDASRISPDLILPTALENLADSWWGQETRYARLNLDGGALWIQHLARRIYTNEGDTYELSALLPQENWQELFNNALLNFHRVQTLAEEGGNENYQGIALVMKCFTFAMITDTWGDIPYSEALKGGAETPIYSPAYESQETVYASMLADLETANGLLKTSGPAVSSSADIMYKGNILKWKKFANSLAVKLANRQAAKKPAESAAILNKIIGNPADYPIFESVGDAASIAHSAVLPSNNMWHQVLVQSSRTDWRMSQTLVNKLKELNDTRLSVFAAPVPGTTNTYEGMPNGLPDALATTYGNASYPGSFFQSPTSPTVFMNYAELLLALAEARLAGHLTAGSLSAQEYFENGMTASFEQYGLSVPAGYLANIGAVSKPKIMEQKWIALFGEGIEAWTEYRRTGLPDIMQFDPRAVFENDGVLPTRITYPASEYSLNEANVRKSSVTDDMKTKLWWAE